MATILLKKKKLTFLQRFYLLEVFKGLFITMRHLIKNMLAPSKMMTDNYPEETKPIGPVHRSEHRLMQREDGTVRCTACMQIASRCRM